MKKDLINVTEYFYGDTESCNSILAYDGVRQKHLPVSSSPIKEYIHDVNRFLFSGGITPNFINLPEDHYGIKVINGLVKKYFTNQLFSLWKTVSITGEVLVTFEIKNGEVFLEFFDPREYEPLFHKDGSLKEAHISTKVKIMGETYVYKFSLIEGAKIEYPLVLVKDSKSYNWEENKTITELPTKKVQAYLIKTNHDLTKNRGNSDFNISSLNLSFSITRMEYGLDENEYFFGNPLIDSPDSGDTIKRLNKKIQVLNKLPNDEGGGHDLLQPKGLSADQIAYLQHKKEAFKRAMGITNTQEVRLNDASGIALRMMNDGLISKAQEKWTDIVVGGLVPLFNQILQGLQEYGIVGLGSFYRKDNVFISRKEPYFNKTENEKLLSLSIAERLIEMGVNRVHALKETYYTHKSIEEIESMLRPNLEDI